MKVHFIVILYYLEGGVWTFNLTEYAGGSITIKCNYTDASTRSPKNFCREGNNKACDEQIRGNTSVNWWQNNERFSLYDNTKKRFFKVTMRNLKLNDAGKYWCRANEMKIKGTEINLTVKDGKRNFSHELGYTGKNISIKCQYDLKKYKNDSKYMCKNEAVGCTDRIRTSTQNEWVYSDKHFSGKERFSLYDNTTAGFFIVSISNLTPEDAGIYWCGIHASFQNSNLSVDNLNEVILTVKNVSRESGDTTGVVPVVACLAVLALVTGVALFICWRCRRNRKVMASNSTSTAQDTIGMRPKADCVYENNHFNTSASGPNTVSAFAQLPSNPKAQPPTDPSTDPTYSTAQSPADHSEGMNYASTTFRKSSSNNDSVTLSKDEPFCYYSTVNYRA